MTVGFINEDAAVNEVVIVPNTFGSELSKTDAQYPDWDTRYLGLIRTVTSVGYDSTIARVPWAESLFSNVRKKGNVGSIHTATDTEIRIRIFKDGQVKSPILLIKMMMRTLCDSSVIDALPISLEDDEDDLEIRGEEILHLFWLAANLSLWLTSRVLLVY
ncbi:uncharacterized protein A4U43_C08F13190 [Asparagus officinalis]|nr:uncharacterized protein A4U43_C08F13190 [Asparagus officinalis]